MLKSSIFAYLKSTLFSIFCFVLFSCSSKENGKINVSNYVDISNFVKSEIERLDSLDPPVLKYSKWNKKSSTDTIKILDWNKELALFSDLKIPQAMWRTDYEIIDSVQMEGELSRTFGALLPNLEIRLFQVVTNSAGDIKRFNIEYRSENRFSKSNRKMSYTKGKGYTIAGLRETLFLDDESYKIVCQYLKPK